MKGRAGVALESWWHYKVLWALQLIKGSKKILENIDIWKILFLQISNLGQYQEKL